MGPDVFEFAIRYRIIHPLSDMNVHVGQSGLGYCQCPSSLFMKSVVVTQSPQGLCVDWGNHIRMKVVKKGMVAVLSIMAHLLLSRGN